MVVEGSEPLAPSRLRFGMNIEASAPKATARRGVLGESQRAFNVATQFWTSVNG